MISFFNDFHLPPTAGKFIELSAGKDGMLEYFCLTAVSEASDVHHSVQGLTSCDVLVTLM